MKKKLIRTRPGHVERTLRTKDMKQPTHCYLCGITKELCEFPLKRYHNQMGCLTCIYTANSK